MATKVLTWQDNTCGHSENETEFLKNTHLLHKVAKVKHTCHTHKDSHMQNASPIFNAIRKPTRHLRDKLCSLSAMRKPKWQQKYLYGKISGTGACHVQNDGHMQRGTQCLPIFNAMKEPTRTKKTSLFA